MRALVLGLLFWITGFQPVTAVVRAWESDRALAAYFACAKAKGESDWECET